MKDALKYFHNDELAANVWLNKYALKDSNGNIFEQTPDEILRLQQRLPPFFHPILLTLPCRDEVLLKVCSVVPKVCCTAADAENISAEAAKSAYRGSGGAPTDCL